MHIRSSSHARCGLSAAAAERGVPSVLVCSGLPSSQCANFMRTTALAGFQSEGAGRGTVAAVAAARLSGSSLRVPPWAVALRRGARDGAGPVYIVVGDGGNREGLAETYDEPQPEWSAFRCAGGARGAERAAA